MLTKKLLIAGALGAALAFAVPAFADPPHWAPAYGWRAKHHHYRPYYPARPALVVVPPQPCYYYAPPRVYYVPPRPAINPPAPVYPDWRVSIGLRF